MAGKRKKDGNGALLVVIALAVALGFFLVDVIPKAFAARAGGGADAGIAVTAPDAGNEPLYASSLSEDGYALDFADGFNAALSTRDDLGIAVTIAVDVSGSMSEPPRSGGKPKYVQAAAAFAQVVDVLERLSRNSPEGQALKVGVVKFNDDVEPLLEPTLMDAAGLRKLRELVADPNAFAPGGSTAIGRALERSVELLSQSGMILRSAIVVTDGENKTGADPAWVMSAVYHDRNTASTRDFPVYTGSTLVSFIGFDIGLGQFEGLKPYGARVMAAADRDELAKALSGLLEADITKLEAGAGGGAK